MSPPSIIATHLSPAIRFESLIVFGAKTVEYHAVENYFLNSGGVDSIRHKMPNVEISNIERVVNSKLARAYLVQQLGHGCNKDELLGFHGTLQADPYEVAKCLDWRYASTDYHQLLGKASYVSMSAEYAHHYANKSTNVRIKRMLVVRFLPGIPFIETSPGSPDAIRRTVPPLGYDSVAGLLDSAGGAVACRAFALFHTSDAYPAYVVTYLEK
jgi:hypothetical protein